MRALIVDWWWRSAGNVYGNSCTRNITFGQFATKLLEAIATKKCMALFKPNH